MQSLWLLNLNFSIGDMSSFHILAKTFLKQKMMNQKKWIFTFSFFFLCVFFYRNKQLGTTKLKHDDYLAKILSSIQRWWSKQVSYKIVFANGKVSTKATPLRNEKYFPPHLKALLNIFLTKFSRGKNDFVWNCFRSA